RERLGETRRAARGAERLLDDDGGDADAAAGDRLDPDETRAERPRSHDQRPGTDHDFLTKIGGAPGPGERRAERVVNGDPGAPRLVVRHGGRDDVEQMLEGGLIARGRTRGIRLRGDPL